MQLCSSFLDCGCRQDPSNPASKELHLSRAKRI